MSTFFSNLPINKRPIHGVGPGVAPGKSDLIESENGVFGPEEFGAEVQVGPPDAAEALVKSCGIKCMDGRPVGVKIFRPGSFRA